MGTESEPERMEREVRQCSREIDLSIVLPVYNEEPNLVPLDSELRSILRHGQERRDHLC